MLEETSTELRLRVEASGDVTVRLGRWVFPGWSLTIDDVSQKLEPNSFGSVDVPLTAGVHQVELSFRAPTARRVGLMVSAVALLVWIGLFVRSRRAGSRRSGAEMKP